VSTGRLYDFLLHVNNLVLTSVSTFEDGQATAYSSVHHDLKAPELSKLRYIITPQGLRHLAKEVSKAHTPASLLLSAQRASSGYTEFLALIG
jgi:hypothetical protein